MYVLMMRVMHVRMSMFHRLVLMLVLVVFSQVQPDTERHQQAGQNQLCGDRFMQHYNGSDRSKKRCRREVRAGSCGPEMALPKVATEMALCVLGYNLTRVMNIVGVTALIEAIQA